LERKSLLKLPSLYTNQFLTAASCPRKDFYTHTPTPPKNLQQTFVLHTQNSTTFVLLTQKSVPKSRPEKVGKKAATKAAIKAAKKFIPEPVLLLP